MIQVTQQLVFNQNSFTKAPRNIFCLYTLIIRVLKEDTIIEGDNGWCDGENNIIKTKNYLIQPLLLMIVIYSFNLISL